MTFWTVLLALLLILISTTCYRLYTILRPRRRKPTLLPPRRKRQHDRTHLLIVLGSGGHTAEMISMLGRVVNDKEPARRLDWRHYTHRTWIVGSGDVISAKRAREFEEMAIGLSPVAQKDSDVKGAAGSSVITTVPRAREIHQPAFTAPISCLRCMMACFIVLLQHAGSERGFPDLVLCNGPATATILILTTVLLRFFNVRGCESEGKMRTVYVESWARVKKLSLSGRLLLRIVDRFLVQWPQLEEATGGKAEFIGVLV